MKQSRLFNQDIIHQIKILNKAEIIQPVQVGRTRCLNELVFFFKPEIFDVLDETKILNTLQLIQKKFDQYDVKVDGAALVSGGVLEEHEIMNRHYGFINLLSRKASNLIDKDTRDRIFEAIECEDTGEYQILGGHEFRNTFNADIDTLSEVWFSKPANKLRSGFYFIEDTFRDKPILLVNGFHPSQLEHFTRPDHLIYLMLLHTNTNWEAMKFDLVGDTFPERANPDSIRGMLYADPQHYGQVEVGINTNGVHLSAGPFEGAFEVVNFFGPLINLDPVETPPLAIKKAIQSGLPEDLAQSLLKNPAVEGSDLFSKTENLNTDIAVEKAVEWITRE